jgi:hypothetical protein
VLRYAWGCNEEVEEGAVDKEGVEGGCCSGWGAWLATPPKYGTLERIEPSLFGLSWTGVVTGAEGDVEEGEERDVMDARRRS